MAGAAGKNKHKTNTAHLNWGLAELAKKEDEVNPLDHCLVQYISILTAQRKLSQKIINQNARVETC